MRILFTILLFVMTAMIMQAKTEEEQIETLYRAMYKAMVAKDTVTLEVAVIPGGCSFISTFPKK